DHFDTTCIGCGCTETDACEGGCAWLAEGVDEDDRSIGVCTECRPHLVRFKAGDFALTPGAIARVEARREEAQLERDMPPPSADLPELDADAVASSIAAAPEPAKKSKRKRAAA